MQQLNLIIFKEVVLNLPLESFKLVLEYSLLSKSCFKFFQNLLVSHDFYKLNKFIITTTQLSDYITQSQNNNNNNNDNNNDKYQFKLIQYKEIQRIKCIYINDVPKYDDLERFKELLVESCPEIKKVLFMNQIKCIPRPNFDYTMDGFFKYKKLLTIWSFLIGQGPLSEYGDENYVEYDDDDDYIVNYVKDYPYSFKFILNYNPSNLIIKTTPTNFYKMNFTNINNILLNYSTTSKSTPTTTTIAPIKRINFKFHNTPINFLQLSFSNEFKIKSLKVRISDISTNLCNNQFQLLLGDNNKLKVLLFRNPLKTKRNEDDPTNNKNLFDKFNNKESDLISLLNILKNSGNKSITTVGFESFIIKDSNSLSTLLSIPQINWIHCNFDSIDSIIDHLSKNQNIKYLTITKNECDNDNIDDVTVNNSLQQLVDNKSLISLQIKK